MANNIKRIADSVKEVSGRAGKAVKAMSENEQTKAAVTKLKKSGGVVADEAVELGLRAVKSEMAKDIGTGAAIGAAVAVPIPLVGPALGALVGGGIGLIVNLRRDRSAGSLRVQRDQIPSVDFHQQMIDLNDLREKGILTQEEFDTQKKKLLKKQ